MVEVGIRELKSRLSYYVQMVQKGEVIAIKVRNHVVGFLSHLGPEPPKESKGRGIRRKDLRRKIEKWKEEGLLLTGGISHSSTVCPVALQGVEKTTDLLRQMRDEE